jgi:ribosomal-protein-alanine N-acetyltransferase
MSEQPTLRTARLELRPATVADLPALHTLWSDPQVRKFLFDDQPVSLDLAKAVLDDCLARSAEGLGLWTVYETNGSALRGCAGLNPTTLAAQYEPALSGLLEPLAAIDPQHWHKGYAHEALGALLDYAFDTLRQSVLAAVNDVPNVASEKMLLRLGFLRLSEVPGPRYRLRTYRLDRKK